MENDEEDNQNLLLNTFKKEYDNQNLTHNITFLKWEQSMKNKYGGNAILFKCKKDDIYFYVSYSECIKHPVYKSNCPKCHKNICYYCSRDLPDYYNENGTCCLKRKIKCMFNQDCYRYINPINTESGIIPIKKAFLSFIIPVVNLLTIITQIQGILYYKLIPKKVIFEDSQIKRYYEQSQLYDYIVTVNIGIAFILVIPLFIIHIYYIIFMLLISLPFKFIPLKYLLGIHYATFNLLAICCS